MPVRWSTDWKPYRVTALAAAGWTVAIAVSLASNMWQRQQASTDAAYAEARAVLNKDISFRRWATEHGGVYVPVTPQQAPVPWMAHIPERDVTTPSGRQLTLLNPASMLRQMMDRHTTEYGIRGRITGLKALNPDNLADSWEAEQLHAFARGERKEVWAVANLNGQPHLRHLRAMYMEPGCEKCHAVMGYKLGDLRGATGVSLPLAPFRQRLHADYLALGASHGGIWLLGLFGIGWVGRKTYRSNQQHRAQELRIAKAELWYRSLFEHSRDGILIFDPASQRFVDFNQQAHEALGYTREEFAAIRIEEINPGETAQDIADRIQRVSAQGWDRFETRHRRKSGDSIDVQVVIQNMYSEDKQYLLTSFRDISQQKNAERALEDYRTHLEESVTQRTADLAEKNKALEEAITQLRLTQEHLVQSEKLAGLGALVAGVAHELNTPIGNGRTIATTLVEQTDDFAVRLAPDGPGLKRSDLQSYVEHMTEGARMLEDNLIRAADLIQSFKQVAVDNTSSMRREFDLQTIVNDVLQAMHPRLKKTPFSVAVSVAPEVTLDSYPGPLGQVLMNLVENAVLHGLDGREAGQIRIGGSVAGAMVELVIEDDGRGIAPEIQGRIFDPFFTTRLGQGGSGLGLNIVHNLVSRVLGGSITVQSDGRSGTRFVVRLPLTAPVGADDDAAS